MCEPFYTILVMLPRYNDDSSTPSASQASCKVEANPPPGCLEVPGLITVLGAEGMEKVGDTPESRAPKPALEDEDVATVSAPPVSHCSSSSVQCPLSIVQPSPSHDRGARP